VSHREHILVIDDDRAIAEGLAMLLEREGRTTIVCADLESAEIVLARYPISSIITDVQFSGEFGFEGLHFLTRIRVQHPLCRIVIMSGHVTDSLRGTALGLGASAVLAKPFDMNTLDRALATDRREGESGSAYESIIVPPIDELLHGGLLSAAYQPIVRLGDGAVTTFGYEALTRIRGSWPAGGPSELFDYAARCDRLGDLNLAALEQAVGNGTKLPPNASLFINIDPSVFDGGKLTAALKDAAARHEFAMSRIVLEITERSGFGEDGAAAAVFEDLRGEGVRFALDDHGSAYSHLSAINVIRPTFIKISPTFGTAFEQDPTRARIVKHVVALAHDFGCKTVLEGVENAETAHAAVELGVDLIQGYHFGRPSAASVWSSSARCAA
jgi:EAL domain-containing protein (putative c-di-GMP-specific phosphodiesterase class I)